MKTIIITLFTILILCSTSYASEKWWKDNQFYSFTNKDKWDSWDKALMKTYTLSTVIDCLQTRYIFDNSNRLYEKNRVLKYTVKKTGRGSIPVYFVALNLANYCIADHLKTFYIDIPFIDKSIAIPTRKIFLFGINSVSYDTVNNNYKIGIKIKL